MGKGIKNNYKVEPFKFYYRLLVKINPQTGEINLSFNQTIEKEYFL